MHNFDFCIHVFVFFLLFQKISSLQVLVILCKHSQIFLVSKNYLDRGLAFQTKQYDCNDILYVSLSLNMELCNSILDNIITKINS